ncbi:MAG: MGMT family protein [Candidatus Micrarchaeia archaeon]|jgi:O-6-methylguanine DNA methyltransferase
MELTAKQKAKLARLTPFQRAVLLECARIPKGRTITYAELARRIGKPRSARAVGNALAINPLAPIIPCHRVLRSDGGLGGYSAIGGTKRKRLLLKKEMGKSGRSV